MWILQTRHEERIVVLQAKIGALPMKDYPPLDIWDAVKAELGVEPEDSNEKTDLEEPSVTRRGTDRITVHAAIFCSQLSNPEERKVPKVVPL